MTVNSLHYHYDVPGDDFTRAGVASGAVKQILKQLGLNPETVRKMSIALYEAEINMVIHGGGGVIDIDIDDDKIVALVSDQGPGIEDLDLAMQEGWSTASEQERNLGFGAGMGLPNMKKYSDELEINSEVGVGTSVKITVNIEKSGEQRD
ncbi:MAG: anti-sigma regulatory factor [Clostridiales bacterium]|jgi:serine/threonine-protein kinase RsbT|nr:anti-sigma regulatory factor [Clostridiales bacterium]